MLIFFNAFFLYISSSLKFQDTSLAIASKLRIKQTNFNFVVCKKKNKNRRKVEMRQRWRQKKKFFFYLSWLRADVFFSWDLVIICMQPTAHIHSHTYWIFGVFYSFFCRIFLISYSAFRIVRFFLSLLLLFFLFGTTFIFLSLVLQCS